MRTKLTIANPEAALGRVLDALASELVTVSDEEILEAARELGMDPMMKGSAAFLGLRTAAIPDFAEFFDAEILKGFDPEILKGLLLARNQALAPLQTSKPRGLNRSTIAVRKDPADE
jgi:hypothetical protein